MVAYAKQDPETPWVFPLPISILHSNDSLHRPGNIIQQNISDLAWFTFLLLLIPREYCQGGTGNLSTKFFLKGIPLYSNYQSIPDVFSTPANFPPQYSSGSYFATKKVDPGEISLEISKMDSTVIGQWWI